MAFATHIVCGNSHRPKPVVPTPCRIPFMRSPPGADRHSRDNAQHSMPPSGCALRAPTHRAQHIFPSIFAAGVFEREHAAEGGIRAAIRDFCR